MLSRFLLKESLKLNYTYLASRSLLSGSVIPLPTNQIQTYAVKKRKIIKKKPLKKVKRSSTYDDDDDEFDDETFRNLSKKRGVDITKESEVKNLEAQASGSIEATLTPEQKEAESIKIKLGPEKAAMMEGASVYTLRRALEKQNKHEDAVVSNKVAEKKLSYETMQEIREALKVLVEAKENQETDESVRAKRVSPIVELAKRYGVLPRSIVRIVKSRFSPDEKSKSRGIKREEESKNRYKNKAEEDNIQLFKKMRRIREYKALGSKVNDNVDVSYYPKWDNKNKDSQPRPRESNTRSGSMIDDVYDRARRVAKKEQRDEFDSEHRSQGQSRNQSYRNNPRRNDFNSEERHQEQSNNQYYRNDKSNITSFDREERTKPRRMYKEGDAPQRHNDAQPPRNQYGNNSDFERRPRFNDRNPPRFQNDFDDRRGGDRKPYRNQRDNNRQEGGRYGDRRGGDNYG
ncbi:hypothetical protein AKO1_015843, partial [Acrasis kona]